MPLEPDPEGNEIRAISDFLTLAGTHVLEIGSGSGRLTRLYANQVTFVAGIDPDINRLAGALEDRLPNAGFSQASALALPFGAGTFDCAILAWSL